MDQEPRTAGAPVEPADQQERRSPEEIRADIDETRQEVGETVAALAEKTDVKSRAQEQARQVSERVRANPRPIAIGGAAVAGLLLWRVAARRP
jgi:ElaB/YqjD/DUF883 family membrane-anchored ribosome-binding protein